METVHKLVELAEEHQIYYELFPYYKNRIALKRDKTLLLSEIQTDELGDVERNEWKSRQEALSEKINWVDEIPEDAYSKFYFFKNTNQKLKMGRTYRTNERRIRYFNISFNNL